MEMTISVNPAIEEQLSRVLSITKGDRDELLEELIRKGLSEKLERVAAVLEGLDDIAAGRTLSNEEVAAKAKAAILRGAAKRL